MTKLARWKMRVVSHDIFRVHELMTCLTDSDIPRSRLNSLSTPWWILAINVKLHHKRYNINCVMRGFSSDIEGCHHSKSPEKGWDIDEIDGMLRQN